MKTNEFSKLVQDYVKRGDKGINHALDLMLIVLSGGNCELCQEVMHLEQQFRIYQEHQNVENDIRDRSHIIFGLLGCVKKMSSAMDDIAPEVSMRIYAYLQNIPSDESTQINIHDTRSSPSKLIGLLGIMGAFSLFLLGALLHRPTSKAIDGWLEAESDSLATYNSRSLLPEVRLSEGLIAYYPFDFNSEDIGPSSRPMINHGATLAPDRLGKNDQAFHFNGIDSWMDLGRFKVDHELSVSMWVTIEEKDATQCLIASNHSKLESPHFSMVYSAGYLYILIGEKKFYQKLHRQEYHHLVLTISVHGDSQSMISFYDNSELLWESVYPTTMLQERNSRWTLGQCWEDQKSTDFFSGTMDELRIYDRPVNEAEVKALYNFERRALHVAVE